MEDGLFNKYKKQIQKQKNEKKEVCDLIEEKTGIKIEESKITISKKSIQINISSVIKQKLFQKDITKVLKEKGYSLN